MCYQIALLKIANFVCKNHHTSKLTFDLQSSHHTKKEVLQIIRNHFWSIVTMFRILQLVIISFFIKLQIIWISALKLVREVFFNQEIVLKTEAGNLLLLFCAKIITFQKGARVIVRDRRCVV